MNMRRVVLDTNILVSALLSPTGNPAKIYQLFFTGGLSLVFSADIFAEYHDVLLRPRLRIPRNDAEILLAAVLQHGEKITPTPSTDAMIDEDDRVFYDTAKSADACLITGNTKHYPQEPFVFTPTAFLDSRGMPFSQSHR
ncbi:MAG: putative toxin-antitoxin system toxin component, PIN family [Oscillospiraceae bacterium]|jgi:putative PIN family toxin of toxin-antitoxin system|nr:putative toxin-antitoxin system toxin component, PIN family [Oscillospiraceae bacterium]